MMHFREEQRSSDPPPGIFWPSVSDLRPGEFASPVDDMNARRTHDMQDVAGHRSDAVTVASLGNGVGIHLGEMAGTGTHAKLDVVGFGSNAVTVNPLGNGVGIHLAGMTPASTHNVLDVAGRRSDAVTVNSLGNGVAFHVSDRTAPGTRALPDVVGSGSNAVTVKSLRDGGGIGVHWSNPSQANSLCGSGGTVAVTLSNSTEFASSAVLMSSSLNVSGLEAHDGYQGFGAFVAGMEPLFEQAPGIIDSESLAAGVGAVSEAIDLHSPERFWSFLDRTTLTLSSDPSGIAQNCRFVDSETHLVFRNSGVSAALLGCAGPIEVYSLKRTGTGLSRSDIRAIWNKVTDRLRKRHSLTSIADTLHTIWAELTKSVLAWSFAAQSKATYNPSSALHEREQLMLFGFRTGTPPPVHVRFLVSTSAGQTDRNLHEQAVKCETIWRTPGQSGRVPPRGGARCASGSRAAGARGPRVAIESHE